MKRPTLLQLAVLAVWVAGCVVGMAALGLDGTGFASVVVGLGLGFLGGWFLPRWVRRSRSVCPACDDPDCDGPAELTVTGSQMAGPERMAGSWLRVAGIASIAVCAALLARIAFRLSDESSSAALDRDAVRDDRGGEERRTEAPVTRRRGDDATGASDAPVAVPLREVDRLRGTVPDFRAEDESRLFIRQPLVDVGTATSGVVHRLVGAVSAAAPLSQAPFQAQWMFSESDSDWVDDFCESVHEAEKQRPREEVLEEYRDLLREIASVRYRRCAELQAWFRDSTRADDLAVGSDHRKWLLRMISEAFPSAASRSDAGRIRPEHFAVLSALDLQELWRTKSELNESLARSGVSRVNSEDGRRVVRPYADQLATLLISRGAHLQQSEELTEK